MDRFDSFAEIIERLERGDEQAANEIFSRFSHRLIALTRTRLDTAILNKVDPEDVVQSVFRSFFTRQAEGQFEFANWDSMWGLLAKLTLRKCGRRTENLLAACRDIRRELQPPGNDSESAAGSWEAVTRDPTPQEVAVFHETISELFAELDDVQQKILELIMKL